MPSLFSRSRTTSSPDFRQKNGKDQDTEIGARSSNLTVTAARSESSKRKDKDRYNGQRPRSANNRSHYLNDYETEDVPDGSYLPLNLDPPRKADDTSYGSQDQSYGYLSHERHVVLGLEQVARLVDIIADEIGTRGLTTPFIFTSQAVDLSSSSIKRIIKTFLATCANPQDTEAERNWRQEARFSGPHELGAVLRWGLARVVRIVGGQEVRGLLAWDHYFDFRDSEMALRYPPAHFATFLPDLPPILRGTILTLLSLLTRLTAHSSSSGHTPPTLSPLFGPLLFGLGPAALAFHHAYLHYLRAVHATEHILLAFIRWQDTPLPSLSPDGHHSSSMTALGVPTRLKDWIRDYPAMLPGIHIDRQKKDQAPKARPGARTVRVLSVRRNVRMYSADLVKTCAGWAQRPHPYMLQERDPNSFLWNSKIWAAIAPQNLKLTPQYSVEYKKKMDLPATFQPDVGPGLAFTAPLSYGVGAARIDTFNIVTEKPQNSERFKNLSDLKWGEFESSGFGGLDATEKALQFDLTESARSGRHMKRQTLTWNDFSAAGFSRAEAPLQDTLQFSTPVIQTISSWPEHNAELSKKLKKTEKALPAFGWDTEPVVGKEESMEQAFLDVFCDLIYGGGWMDLERLEDTDRECNWALVEFKAIPANNSSVDASDPRIDTRVVLFEEFVPFEYRQQLVDGAAGKSSKLPNLFSSKSKPKQWKPATTLNGRPYVVGHVPPSATFREVEFEGLIRGNPSATKVISASKQGRASHAPSALTMPSDVGDYEGQTKPGYYAETLSPVKSTRGRESPEVPNPPPKRNSLLKPLQKKSGLPPAEYSSVEFETRLASDDSLSGRDSPSSVSRKSKKKHDSMDEAWVDILVGSQSRRMGDQSAVLGKPEMVSNHVSDESKVSDAPLAETLPNGSSRPPLPKTPPAKSPISEFADVPEEESIIAYRRPQGLGYFDLHPDRRPNTGKQRAFDTDEGEEDTVEDIAVYGPPEPMRKLPTPPVIPSPPLVVDTPSPPRRQLPRSPGEVVVTPPEVIHSPSASKGKTAALVEMYKQKDLEAAAVPRPIPGVPARSASLTSESTPVVAAPSPPVTPPPSEVVPPVEHLEEPPALLVDTGRISPGRYVHGAPLHNVAEEEEEED